MIKGFRFKTIRAKLMARYVPMMAISILALFLVLEVRFYQSERERLVQDLSELMDVEHAAMVDALWEFDQPRINGLIVELEEIPYLLFATVTDNEGVLISRTSNVPLDIIESDLLLTTDLVYTHSDGHKEKIGTLTIAAHTAVIWEKIYERIKIDLLIFLFVIAVLIAITIIATRQVIDQPLQKLKYSIDRARETGEVEPVEWASSDEFGDVVFTYNEMQVERATNRAELEEYQQNLENLVEERTAELKQSQREAENQRQLLQVVLDSMTDGVAAFDKDLKLIFCNNHFLDIREFPDYFARPGTPFEQFINYDLARHEFGDKPGEEEKRFQLERAKKFQPHEIERQRPNGTYIRVRGGPIPGGGFVSTYSDITASKESEEMLQLAKEKAEAASEAKASFLAAMSHEIRTPMNGVIGMIDLLMHTNLTQDQVQMMSTVRDSAFSLLTIINDILDFSKIEAGKMSLEKEPLSIEDIVEGVAETLAVNARDKEDFFILSYVDPEIPKAVLGDEVRLRQILFNLAGNAVKFTEKGKVMVMASRLYSEEMGAIKVRFDIIDTGVGIAKENLNSLFKPFEQAEASTTRRFGGTGLGLTICQHLVKLMRGNINVESEVGKGSIFTVNIPMKVAEKQPERTKFFDCSGLRILTMVSDDDIRPLISGFLSYDGADVSAAVGEENAFEKLISARDEGRPYNVFLIGSAWAHEEKIKLVDKVRAIEGLEKTRFVFLNRDRARMHHQLPPDTVEVASYPFRQSALLKGIGVVAGRASPDIHHGPCAAEQAMATPPTIEEAAAKGLLILVAEDNKINQDVIRRQLNVLGFAAELADDGAAALTLFNPDRHAMILTDCHMPNMDGFELTKAIRQLDVDKGADVPIVAITANALQGEKQRCLDEGMDDFLPKPIDISKLRLIFEKWLPDRSDVLSAMPFEKIVNDEEGQASEDIEKGVVDVMALCEAFGADDDTAREILASFALSLQEGLAEIEAAYKAKDAHELEETAHRLKSSSRTVGAFALADIFESLEKAGVAEDWDVLDQTMPLLDPSSKAVLNFIEDWK